MARRKFRVGDVVAVIYLGTRGTTLDKNAVVTAIEERDGRQHKIITRLSTGEEHATLNHPDYIVHSKAPAPIPVPAATTPGESAAHVEVIFMHLAQGGFNARGRSIRGVAEYVFAYCQGGQVDQAAIDRALETAEEMCRLDELADSADLP